MKEKDLVMLRLETPYGYSNTWWRVMFIDNDETFIGQLEKCDWIEYQAHTIGETERFNTGQEQHIYKEGDQFCYSDGITICECSALCKNK